ATAENRPGQRAAEIRINPRPAPALIWAGKTRQPLAHAANEMATLPHAPQRLPGPGAIHLHLRLARIHPAVAERHRVIRQEEIKTADTDQDAHEKGDQRILH